MRFHTLLVLSLVALTAVCVPTVASKHVTVNVEVDLPQHHGAHHLVESHQHGAAAMSAIPEVPHERVGEHGEVPHEAPRERITGNRGSLDRLRQEIIERHNRNAGKEILGGHPEKGPDRPAGPAEIERIRLEKEMSKEIEREYQAELKALRSAKVTAEREARYAKMNERQAKNAREIDELHDINKVMGDELRVENDRVKQLEDKIHKNDPNRIQAALGPEGIVEAIHLQSVRMMYTDHEMNIDERKKERLSKDMPDFEAQQNLQRTLKEKKDRLLQMIDPIAQVKLVKITSRRWDGRGYNIPETFYRFPEDAKQLTDWLASNSRNNVVAGDIPAGEKNEAMAFVARDIQIAENGIHQNRVNGIKSHIQRIEKVINDNNVRVKVIEDPRSEHNQIF